MRIFGRIVGVRSTKQCQEGNRNRYAEKSHCFAAGPQGRRPLFAGDRRGYHIVCIGTVAHRRRDGPDGRGHRGADAAGAREHFGHSRRGGVCAVGCGEDHRPVAGHRGFRRDERRLRHLFHRRAAGARLLRGGASADGCARRDRRRGGQGLTSRGCPGGETPLCGPSFDGAARWVYRLPAACGTVHLRFGGVAHSDSEERFVDSFRELFRFECPVLRFLAFFLTLPQKVIPFTKPI